MRPHGRATVSRSRPHAFAICDRCGFQYNHKDLEWQYQWAGPRLQNLRILVCRTCMDMPQEGLRTIIIPPDPVPISNPRPEAYDSANNASLVPAPTLAPYFSSTTAVAAGAGNAAVGQDPNPLMAGSNIGTLVGGGGTYSAFTGSSNKPFSQSAYLLVSGSSFTNWVGKDWSAAPNAAFLPTTINSTGLVLVAEGFAATAPRDARFLASGATAYAFQGSSDASTWTTLASGITAGTAGENISNSNLGGNSYRYHRFVISGDGSAVAISQLTINTNRGVSVQ